MKVEEEFRLAKLKKDVVTLDRVLAEACHETNQNGNTRNKAQLIELFRYFPIASLTTDSSQVQVTGETAVVTGSQTEHNSTGVDRMLFTRVYVKTQVGWQLLASTQFRDPKQGPSSGPFLPVPQAPLMHGDTANATSRIHTLETRFFALEERVRKLERATRFRIEPVK